MDTNPTALAAMTDEQAKREAKRIITNFATSYRDDRPLPTRGDAPPVPQPGIPPQSKAAVDYAVRVLSTGATSLLVGGSASLVMMASDHADPLVIGIICVAPATLAVPIHAFARLMKRAKETVEAMPAEQHNHYNGPVTQTTVSTQTTTRNTGVWAKTHNQQPR